MTSGLNRGWRRAGLAGVLVLALLLTGCRDSRHKHHPPEGYGAMVVDNYTGSRVSVYVDGLEVEQVSSGKYRAYDMEPGVYRVVLVSRHSDATWTGDVDVLEDRLTILEVDSYYMDYRTLDVSVWID